MSTNMTGGADGGIAIQVRLNTSKASKELNRLEQKILKLQEEVTVGQDEEKRPCRAAGTGECGTDSITGEDED